MHWNAKLTPLGRAQMVRMVLVEGKTPCAAAAAHGVCEKTARRWCQRAREEGLQEAFFDRSCTPMRQPRRTPPDVEARVVELRRTRMSYPQIVMHTKLSQSAVWNTLKRHGLNRLSALEPPKPPVIRYERATPGELIHLDIKKLGRFVRPGVRGTGDRANRSEGAGVESVHVAIDDHSRLAFACVLNNEKIPSVLDALDQAVAFYRDHGVLPQAILTDRGASYRSHAFKAACHQHGLKHLFTRPYRPQTNGKAERFIQTLSREWAYAFCYQNSDERTSYLPWFLHDYNWHRPHSGINRKSPITRLPLYSDKVSEYNS
jgi:transposase InsO family protein